MATPTAVGDGRGDALARPVRGRAGRRAAGVHRQPPVRPAAGARRPRRVAGPRPRAWSAASILDGDEAVGDPRRARPGRARSWPTGTFAFAPTDEDIHTAVERRVTELAGPAGGQAPHRAQPQRPGRHRPAAVHQAGAGRRRHPGARVPGHAARPGRGGRRRLPARLHAPAAGPAGAAGPPPAGPRLGAGARRRPAARHPASGLDVSPLGAGALAGSSLPLDPHGVAADLGFAAAFDNSLDAVSDRDFVAEALFDLALLGVHLSRIGEEVVLWSSEEFGFLRLADAYATGSRRCCRRRRTPTSPSWPAGKAGRLDRPPHRPAHDAEGPAARLQP